MSLVKKGSGDSNKLQTVKEIANTKSTIKPNQKMKIIVIFSSLLFSINLLAQKTVEVKCDSIYNGKGIQIKLKTFDDEKEGYDGGKNAILLIEQNSKNRKSIIVNDSIYSSVQKIEFADFNNDKIKDLLVQNISDVRSNWTYNLYLYNPKTTSFKQVKGFEKIKNPLFNTKYNIIESHVNSGTNWIGFYKIIKHSVHNYNIEIDDRGDKNSEKEYKKAITKILKTKI